MFQVRGSSNLLLLQANFYPSGKVYKIKVKFRHMFSDLLFIKTSFTMLLKPDYVRNSG